MPKEINQKLINEILEAQSQKIDYIALSGGGFQGILYIGMYEALLKAGILPDVKSVSGASAGIFGTLAIAFNPSMNYIYQFGYDTYKNIAFNFFADNFLMLQGTSKGVCKIIEDSITKTISEYFSEINIDQVINNQINKIQKEINNNQENKDLQDRLFKLKKIQTEKLEIDQLKGDQITFHDLSLLRAIDPEMFKGLVITATRKDSGELEVFNAQNAPSVKIIDAFRASFALPIFIKPHEINGVEYIDGAFKEMLPFGHFESGNIGDNNSIKNGRILSVALDCYDQGLDFYGHIAIHSNQERIFSNITRNTLSIFFSLVNKIAGIGGNCQINKNLENTLEFLSKNPLNTIILKSPIILSHDAYKVIDNIHYTYRTSYVQTMQYLQNHNLVLKDKIDENLEIKGLVIRLYEEICQEFGPISQFFGFSNKKKQDEILNFAKEEAFENKTQIDILSDLIMTVCGKDSSNIDKSTTNKLIAILQDPYVASLSLKGQFANLLGVKISSDPKQVTKDLINLKFQLENFEDFIEFGGLIPGSAKIYTMINNALNTNKDLLEKLVDKFGGRLDDPEYIYKTLKLFAKKEQSLTEKVSEYFWNFFTPTESNSESFFSNIFGKFKGFIHWNFAKKTDENLDIGNKLFDKCGQYLIDPFYINETMKLFPQDKSFQEKIINKCSKYLLETLDVEEKNLLTDQSNIYNGEDQDSINNLEYYKESLNSD